MKTVLTLQGLTCAACQKLITKRIATISDIEEVKVELPGTATITAPREIKVQEVKKVLLGTHYSVIGEKII